MSTSQPSDEEYSFEYLKHGRGYAPGINVSRAMKDLEFDARIAKMWAHKMSLNARFARQKTKATTVVVREHSLNQPCSDETTQS